MKLTRSEVLRKCIIVFDAIKRASSKSNIGLEPMPGKEESFQTDSDICDTLREMLRELEAGTVQRAGDNPAEVHDWQIAAENGPPERLVF